MCTDISIRRNLNNLSKWAWLVLLAVCFGFAAFRLIPELSSYFREANPLQIAAVIFLGFLVLALACWLFRPIFNIRTQKARNQPSWVYYCFFGLVLSPVTSLLFVIFSSGQLPNPLHVLLVSIAAFVGTAILFLIPPIGIRTAQQFAAGAVGLGADQLDFTASATAVARGIQDGKRHVEVIGLYGGLGFGKSSYARMIIESLDREKVLYTYLSLTETNEAKDFSKLFAERWLETIRQRYPKIDTALALSFMRSIVRESGNGWMAGLLFNFPILHRGLLKTEAKVFDEHYNSDVPQFTSNTVSGIFGNIPRLIEDLWVVMLDEIERAKFDEIYRVIEVIERFKSEGRSGLPLRLVFVLCISEPELKNTLEPFKGRDRLADLIYQFFYSDPKSITQKLFLPPVSAEQKRDYIQRQLINTQPTNGASVPKDIYPDTATDTRREFISDGDKALAYMFGVLSTVSPRTVARCADGVVFFGACFRNALGGDPHLRFRLADLVAMEYIKIRHPFIIEFFKNTIELLMMRYREAAGGRSREGLDAYSYKTELRKGEVRLADWITQETMVSIPDQEKERIEKIVGFVSFDHVNFLSQDDPRREDVERRYKSLSYAPNLQDYLHLISEKEDTPFKKYNEVYVQHQNKRIGLEHLSPEELMGYSRFLGGAEGAHATMNLDAMIEIGRRVREGEVRIVPRELGDSVFDDFIYQFVFQLANFTEKDPGQDTLSTGLRRAFEGLNELLGADAVPTGAKYLILNSLANDRRGGGSEIHARLQRAFSMLRQHWDSDIKILIGSVFEEADRRYFAQKKLIYENEENYIFVMYQGWSGRSDAREEIQRIRSAARRGLEHYPDAIAAYWKPYKYDKRWVSYEDVKNPLKGDHWWGVQKNNELYMPLETLIEVTRGRDDLDPEVQNKFSFWENTHANPDYRRDAQIRNDPDTLRAVLIDRELLPGSTGDAAKGDGGSSKT